jgi:RNA polymerase sigma-70 factor (ECF subfamily)
VTAEPARTLDPEGLGEHLDRLYAAARALTGCPHDAQDLVQATYERVLRRPRLLHGDDDLGYLLRALRHTFYSQRRAQACRPCAPADPGDFELHASERPGPADALEHTLVLDAVAALPDAYRDTVVAVDVAGLSYRETAQLLDTAEGTVMSRLFRARRRLAETLAVAA